jgi:hypothetical protein
MFFLSGASQVNYQQFLLNQSPEKRKQKRRQTMPKECKGEERGKRRKAFIFCDIFHGTIKAGKH